MVTINTIMITLTSILFLYIGYSSLKYSNPSSIPEKPMFLWGESTGKERSIQSKTGDASMKTELRRRQTIQGFGRMYPSKIKESRTSTGSSTGAIESFLISGICKCTCNNPDVIIDGGFAVDEFCPVHGNVEVYDAGGADTRVCGI